MKLTSLSTSTFSSFGVLLNARSAAEGDIEEDHVLFSSDEIKICRCSKSVILDYAEGMTVLAIYEDEKPVYFYLDRIVQINAGVAFALFPFEQSSSLVEIRPADCILEVIETRQPFDAAEDPPRFAIEKIVTVFYQETSGNFYFRGESHPPYELTYVDQGTLHNIINGHDHVVSQQEFIIIGRNQWHIQYSDLPVKFLTVSFSHTGDLPQTITDRVMRLPSSLKGVLSKILVEQSDAPFSSEYLEALMQVFLIELIREPDIHAASAKAPATSFSENLLVDKALKMISRNISGKITLIDLAYELHISVPYLYKLFDEHLKMPPGQYIMKIRLEESKMLLREGSKRIGDVARECGFTSIQHYSRQFRAHFQISPSEYIKSLR